MGRYLKKYEGTISSSLPTINSLYTKKEYFQLENKDRRELIGYQCSRFILSIWFFDLFLLKREM
jgi:hypothetical protein